MPPRRNRLADTIKTEAPPPSLVQLPTLARDIIKTEDDSKEMMGLGSEQVWSTVLSVCLIISAQHTAHVAKCRNEELSFDLSIAIALILRS